MQSHIFVIAQCNKSAISLGIAQIKVLSHWHKISKTNIFSLAQFRTMDLPFTLVTWMRIRNALLHFRGGPRELPKKTISIFDFLNSWKKGGKKLRTVVNCVQESDIKLSETRCFLTFSCLIELAPDPEYNLSTWLSAWNISSLTNNLRVFIFNCRYNSLPLNDRLNSYMPEINPLCTFCRLSNCTPVPRDSMLHCFYNCPYAQLLITHLKGWLGMDRDIEYREFSLLYWYGSSSQCTLSSLNKLAYILIFDILRYIFLQIELENDCCRSIFSLKN
jgi:hypothetical protein